VIDDAVNTTRRDGRMVQLLRERASFEVVFVGLLA
jgi:hypothetical protein